MFPPFCGFSSYNRSSVKYIFACFVTSNPSSSGLCMGILFSIFLPSERYVIMPYVPLMFVLWPKTEPSQSGKLPFLINMQLFLEHVISDCTSGLFMGQNNSGLAQPR